MGRRSLKVIFQVFIFTLFIASIPLASIPLFGDDGCGCGSVKSFNIDTDPKDAYNMIINLKESPSFVVLDVRTPEEFKSGHIEGAINIDFYSSDFKDQLTKLSKTKTYLVYCRSGARSTRATELMEKMGFTKIYNLKGGIIKWEQEKLPLVK